MSSVGSALPAASDASLVYRSEPPLFAIALVYAGFAFIAYLFIQSAAISYLRGNGVFNAFATRFLGRNFIVLMSDVVDALEAEPESINFYIGHELGHIRRSHLLWGPLLFPASILPLLGAAYSRARE